MGYKISESLVLLEYKHTYSRNLFLADTRQRRNDIVKEMIHTKLYSCTFTFNDAIGYHYRRKGILFSSTCTWRTARRKHVSSSSLPSFIITTSSRSTVEKMEMILLLQSLKVIWWLLTELNWNFDSKKSFSLVDLVAAVPLLNVMISNCIILP